MNLQESSLLHSLSSLKRYNAKDIADLCFLYMVALHILRSEFDFAPQARSYASKTLGSGDFQNIRLNKTDLYQLLNILLAQDILWTDQLQNPSASHTFLTDIYLNHDDVVKFLRNIQQGGFNPTQSARLLLKMENQLKVSTTNYKSVRRIASDWNKGHVDKHAKSLVVTRLLLQGDLRVLLEQLAQSQNLEYNDACNQETGANCGVSAQMSSTKKEKKPSLLKQLAVGTGLGIGAYLLGKALFAPKDKK
jgi:hypothetical protein